ncbi:MAG: c-type cytochrome [Cupriavidus sp.]|nr:c-type cytochrome [Cupriavidus sp.]
MNAPPAQVWLNTLLTLLQDSQFAVLRLWHALGLTGDSHGQPAWPWARRIAGETLLIDLGLARQVAWSVAAIGFALTCVAVAIVWRHRRLTWLGVAALALILAPWPAPALLFTPAAPTSFHTSPTRFSAEAIARGGRLYAQHCSACHGDDGRGEGPLAASLPHWPPTFVGPLLGRRADGELFAHIVDGMHDTAGWPTMPAFGQQLGDDGAWAVLDYTKALAAGTAASTNGNWPIPLRLADVSVRCGQGAPRPLADWRGNQRVRVVAFDGEASSLPLEDPRFLTLLVTRDGSHLSDVPQFRADCVADSPHAWAAFAQLAGIDTSRLAGTEFLADRQGWLRARALPSRSPWDGAGLLCTAGQAGSGQGVNPSAADGLTALLLRMDAEPVRFVQGGFIH